MTSQGGGCPREGEDRDSKGPEGASGARGMLYALICVQVTWKSSAREHLPRDKRGKQGPPITVIISQGCAKPSFSFHVGDVVGTRAAITALTYAAW